MTKKRKISARNLPAQEPLKISQSPEEDLRPRDFDRRAFLQLGGASLAVAALSGCETPLRKATPYLDQPEEITPGIANWYASACAACPASCGLLVRTREGRPVKLEGNDLDRRTGGGLCALGQASIWALYDPQRLAGPSTGGKPAQWDEVDRRIQSKLAELAGAEKNIRLLTGTITSPTEQEAIEQFLERYPTARHISYDAVSAGAILRAHKISHGQARTPTYRFDRAKFIAAFDADFLGTWLSPVEFTSRYATTRTPAAAEPGMSRHVQFESRMSLTGANADQRVCIAPSEQLPCLLWLARRVAERAAAAGTDEFKHLFEQVRTPADQTLRSRLDQVAASLWANRGASLVVSGSNDTDTQLVVNYLNHALGNEGRTVEPALPSCHRRGDEAGMIRLVEAMSAGEVGALIVWGTNPAYFYPRKEEFAQAVKRVDLTVSLGGWPDETASLMNHLCPDHHFLEAWGDAEVRRNLYNLRQPVIRPLGNTRQGAESLLKWAGRERTFQDCLKEFWRETIFAGQDKYRDFQAFWNAALAAGVYQAETGEPAVPSEIVFRESSVLAAIGHLPGGTLPERGPESTFELDLHESVALRDGSYAQIPWLQELPDPVTKVTWENVAALSPAAAARAALEQGDVVRITYGQVRIELPVVIQPGQHDRTVSIALGYGRTHAGKAGSGTGADAYALVARAGATFSYSGTPVKLEPTGRRVVLALSQTHERTEGRPIVRQQTLASYLNDTHEDSNHAQTRHSLWKPHGHEPYRWAMGIDLNACTGCGACVIACQAENNIPAVGKSEVRRRREMHWIRIDRYYTGQDDELKVLFQPMMCSQCDNAPCETVCPTLATVHSSDGLNTQVYNRCIGTRYCANNCPFKVRRFNWFNYYQSAVAENLALNPDVTVRSRGVMEKCTFCVQRIQEKKILARNERRLVADGEIQPACQQSCPAGAIVFGNLKDPESRVSRLFAENRSFRVLEELNIDPAVAYQTKIRNTSET